MSSSDRRGWRYRALGRRGHRDDARVEVALAVTDRSLEAGEPTGSDGGERELGQLALTLRAGSPAPSERFEAELERMVRSGFAAPENGTAYPNGRSRRAAPRASDRPDTGAALPSGRLRRRFDHLGASLRARISAPAVAAIAGAAGALALGVGVLAGGVGDSGSGTGFETAAPLERPSGTGAGAGRSGASEELTRDLGRGEAPSSTVIAPEPPLQSGALAPEAPERHVERSASLDLEARPDAVDAVAAGIVAVVARHRGFVTSSSTFASEQSGARGNFDLRVPSDRLRPAVTDLARLATVRSQSESGTDITAPVETTADRLKAARAERRGLLGRLATADTDREASALRQRLRLVSGEVRGAESQLEALRERADYARVSVALTDGSDAGAATGDTTGDALEDAVATLVAAFNFVVRVLGVLLPLALVAALLWLAWRSLQRRRREAVLG